MDRLTNSYWKEKDVLVTGHTGFKGMWLSIYLSKMGAKVIGLSDNCDDDEKLLYQNIDRSKIFCHEEFLDIRDLESIKNIIPMINPEVVFHLAAQPLVRLSYQRPIETFQTNIMGTINVLESIRMSPKTNKVICVTSDKCYRNVEQLWGYREHDPLGGQDPYSASKGAAEIVAYSMWSSFLKEQNVSMATVRAGNVIGGGDFSSDRIITDIVNAKFRDESFDLRNPTATRPWQHVLEPVHAYASLVEEKMENTASYYDNFNIGPDYSNVKSVNDLVNEVSKYWRLGSSATNKSGKKVHEATLLSLDNSKVKNETTWKPKWDFETTVRKTLNWYEQFFDGQDPFSLCDADINDYYRGV